MKNFSVKSIGQVVNDQEEIAIQLSAEYVAGLSGLNGFSHLVVLWWPNQMDSDEARSMLEVPKPYKNAPDTMGIFATRSPVRPNPIAMTVVDILSIDETTGRIIVPYIDAFDGTPVFRFKALYAKCR
ncbi:SAM-dependent methyltransferase [Enterococcus sp. AZ103]|uniref:SAM-dependent methyltransferase n=1 Tax=Enterococcus sp. AZ103 TaxID=2774628 RepID=UPI003F261D16